MKVNFRKILKAFEEEPETDPEDDPERIDDKRGQGEPAQWFYPNKDWEQRFCKHCQLARAVVIIGDDDREYVCNRIAGGNRDCPWESANREGYRQSVPLTPGPPPGRSNEDVMNYLDKVNDGLDDVIDSMESIVEAKKEKGHWSKGGRRPDWICSKCGQSALFSSYEYCPNCGSPMEVSPSQQGSPKGI